MMYLLGRIASAMLRRVGEGVSRQAKSVPLVLTIVVLLFLRVGVVHRVWDRGNFMWLVVVWLRRHVVLVG